MHIPDGYLSPASCVTLYGLSIAGWYASLHRVKRTIATRTIPLISVFASFSFVIMMFNLPLPVGTTGHATGVAIATIALGPWGSILAISIALAIQALSIQLPEQGRAVESLEAEHGTRQQRGYALGAGG